MPATVKSLLLLGLLGYSVRIFVRNKVTANFPVNWNKIESYSNKSCSEERPREPAIIVSNI